MEERNLRKTRVGVVSSDKMDKTVVVTVKDKIKHPLYKKIVNRTIKFKAHDEKNECGLSGQYARFQQGSEYSLEVTWKRQLTESISLQPSFQYIKNDNGDFTALSARLYVSF